MDPDPYRFEEVMYLKQYFLYILTWFSLSVGPTGPNQKAYLVKFFLSVNFFVLIRVAYGPDPDPDPRTPGNGSRIRILEIIRILPDPDPQNW
jgi:hypothetical protein